MGKLGSTRRGRHEKCGQSEGKRLLINVFKMAEANPDADYNRLEKEFINRTYESRLIQKAKEDGKLICPEEAASAT